MADPNVYKIFSSDSVLFIVQYNPKSKFVWICLPDFIGQNLRAWFGFFRTLQASMRKKGSLAKIAEDKSSLVSDEEDEDEKKGEKQGRNSIAQSKISVEFSIEFFEFS